MRRRNFLATLAKLFAVFAVLPSATTYARTWSGVLVPKKKLARVRYTFGPDGEVKLELSESGNWIEVTEKETLLSPGLSVKRTADEVGPSGELISVGFVFGSASAW